VTKAVQAACHEDLAEASTGDEGQDLIVEENPLLMAEAIEQSSGNFRG